MSICPNLQDIQNKLDTILNNINQLKTANNNEVKEYQSLFTQIATDIKTTQSNIMRLQQNQEQQLQKIQNTSSTQQQLKQLSRQIDDTLLTFTQILLNHFSYIIINQDSNALSQLYQNIRKIRLPTNLNTNVNTVNRNIINNSLDILNQLIEILVSNTKLLKKNIKNNNKNNNMLPITTLNKMTENFITQDQQQHLDNLLNTLQNIVKISITTTPKASNSNYIREEMIRLQTEYINQYSKLQELQVTIDQNVNMSNNLFNTDYMTNNLAKVANIVLAIVKQYYLLGSIILKYQKFNNLI